jgi:hypothetical protein
MYPVPANSYQLDSHLLNSSSSWSRMYPSVRIKITQSRFSLLPRYTDIRLESDPDSAYSSIDALKLPAREGDEGREHYLEVGYVKLHCDQSLDS